VFCCGELTKAMTDSLFRGDVYGSLTTWVYAATSVFAPIDERSSPQDAGVCVAVLPTTSRFVLATIDPSIMST
jgi:hypothetical protein